MTSRLGKLEKKRAQLEVQILQAKQAEKRKSRVLQHFAATLEMHPSALEASEEIFRAKLEILIEELAQEIPGAEK